MAANAQSLLTVQVLDVGYRNPASCFTVLRLASAAELASFSGCGVIPFEVRKGDELRVEGAWGVHPRFGRQFEIATAATQVPATTAGIARYLATRGVRGVGPRMAQRVVDALGDSTLELLADNPNALLRVKGLGRNRIAALALAVREGKAEQQTLVALAGLGLSPTHCAAVAAAFGAAAPTVVMRDPWSLAGRFRGIGFKTADELAQRNGNLPDAPQRMRAALLHRLQQAQHQGHTALPPQELLRSAADLTALEAARLVPALQTLVSNGECAMLSHATNTLVYQQAMAACEFSVASALRQLALAPKPNPVALQNPVGISLTPEQRAAATLLLQSKCAVLTGGPGVGKTTVLRAVVDSLYAAGRTVALASPTGRAAKRLADVVGRPASTLHRLFGLVPGLDMVVGGGTGQDADVLLIDETSMVDLILMHQVLQQLPPNAVLLLTGDADQLPPVGPGKVFSDLIESGLVPVARLTEVHRQAEGSAIVSNAHRVLHGQMPRFDAPSANNDCFFMERDTAVQGAALITDLFLQRLPARYGLDPRSEIQILTPMHAGAAGTQQLNALVQAGLRPAASDATPPHRLVAGDRVMMTRNDHQRSIMNGDVGTVESVDRSAGVAHVAFDGRSVRFEGEALDDLVAAYAMTVHKSQGSEYPGVILALFQEHHILLRRNLLYTAMTRARRLLVIVGQTRALEQAVRDARLADRHGFLKARLSGEAPCAVLAVPAD